MAPRIAPDFATTRDLFVHSGNECAFPECDRRLVNLKGQWVGEICHIEAASPGGERFNRDLSPLERSQRENLLLLCHDHHVETNDVNEFPVERMREIKADHERRFTGPPPVSDEVLEQAVQDIIAASIEDITDRVVLHLPESMEGFSTEMRYDETAEERLSVIEMITPRLQALRRLPVDTRAVFAILLARTRPGRSVELPLHELELVTNTSPQDMAVHIEMLERFRIAGLEQEFPDERAVYWQLGAFQVDGWDFWADFRSYCDQRGLDVKEIVNELKFNVLDG